MTELAISSSVANNKNKAPASKRGGKEKPPKQQPKAHLKRAAQHVQKMGLGKQIGSSFGPLGTAAGSLADHLFGRIVGSGSYELQGGSVDSSNLHTNSLIRPVSSNTIPSMHIDAQGAIRVSKREYLFDIKATTSASVTGFRVEPQVFPWLSQVSTAWSKWIMTGCVFEYIPLSGYAVSGTSAALGSVSMTSISDVGAITSGFPVTKVDLLTYDNSVSGSPAAPLSLGVECAPDMTQMPVKYIRGGGSSLSTFVTDQVALAQLQIITTGAPGIYTCGEIWVTYDVVLLEPRKFLPISPSPSGLSVLAKEFLRVHEEYEGLLDSGPFVALTPEEFVRKQAKMSVLASRLNSPTLEEGRSDYLVACELVRLAKETAIEEERAEKVRALVEAHKEFFGDAYVMPNPPVGGAATR